MEHGQRKVIQKRMEWWKVIKVRGREMESGRKEDGVVKNN